MVERFNAPFAAELWAARLAGTTVARPTPLEIDAIGDGYRTQADIVSRSNDKHVGWKVGSTSAQAQARLGTNEPGAGALLARFCYPNDAHIPVSRAHGVFVEAEFVLELGRALTPRPEPFSLAEVSACVRAIRPGLEFVGSRFEGGLSNIGRALITADGGGNVAFTCGEPVTAWHDIDLPGARATLWLNGLAVEHGTGERALGSPMNVLLWLANHLSARGIDLEAGELVSTGTCTGLVSVTPGDAVIGNFGSLGNVQATLCQP
ncbi:MAG: 2-keto-4-pentenoate hydratase [Gammaproteobacteria bacterium]|jgi:2-keto-4-pentenoate hydratase